MYAQLKHVGYVQQDQKVVATYEGGQFNVMKDWSNTAGKLGRRA